MTAAKLAIVYGTRPEAIKLAPVIELARSSDTLDVTVICTGQHQELLRNAEAAFAARPDVELGLMRDAQTPAEFVSRTMARLDRILEGYAPDMLLVQGDTASAFSATLAAFHRGILTGHVEAGLRTHDLAAPFPEEGYRQAIDRLAQRLYAPTEGAERNLLAEGRRRDDILVTGNTGIDAVLSVVASGIGTCTAESPFVLATLHRRESFGEPLRRICEALRRIVLEGGLSVILPVHRNPTVSAAIHEALDGVSGVSLCEPLAYPDMVRTMQRAVCVITDSGGIQEEAPTLGVPVLVTRETTERPEGLEAGSALLVGHDVERIAREVLRLHGDAGARAKMSNLCAVYGDGKASVRIVADVARMLGR